MKIENRTVLSRLAESVESFFNDTLDELGYSEGSKISHSEAAKIIGIDSMSIYRHMKKSGHSFPLTRESIVEMYKDAYVTFLFRGGK